MNDKNKIPTPEQWMQLGIALGMQRAASLVVTAASATTDDHTRSVLTMLAGSIANAADEEVAKAKGELRVQEVGG